MSLPENAVFTASVAAIMQNTFPELVCMEVDTLVGTLRVIFRHYNTCVITHRHAR